MSQLQEIVINSCYGHFGLSRKAFLRLRELGSITALAEPDYGEPWPDDKRSIREKYLGDQFCVNIPRDDVLLVKVVKEFGSDACGMDAGLCVVTVSAPYSIVEDDGLETVQPMKKKNATSL